MNFEYFDVLVETIIVGLLAGIPVVWAVEVIVDMYGVI